MLEVCARIPRGKVTTYAEIARALGKPKAVRAVGNALNKNPFAPRIPCHRVVKSSGEIGGYAKGRAEKERLLRKEGVAVKAGVIPWHAFCKSFFRLSRSHAKALDQRKHGFRLRPYSTQSNSLGHEASQRPLLKKPCLLGSASGFHALKARYRKNVKALRW